MTRNYSSTAVRTSLLVSVGSGDATLFVDSSSGYPQVPFFATINRGQSNQEVVLVTTVSGTQWTVTRGQDGHPRFAHEAGSTVEHVWTATDARDAAEHAAKVTGAHGLASGDTVAGAASVAAAQSAAQSFATSAVSTHSALATGVHGVGASTVASAASVAAVQAAVDAVEADVAAVPKIQYGSVSTGPSSASSFTRTVSFPQAFSSTPVVMVNLYSGAGATAQWNQRAISISTSGFTVFGFGPSAATFTATYQWLAVGPG